MKPALQALLIAPDQKMRENVVMERKQISIREGHRDYKPGPMMLCCHLEPWGVMVDVTEVRHCILEDVTSEEYEADGFHTKGHLFKGMKQYYKTMDWDSPVTVIRWKNARGKLVDDYRERMKCGGHKG